MKIRLKKYDKGWIAEYRVAQWGLFGLKYKWVYITHYAGMEDKPFFYKTPQEAMDGAIKKIKNQIWFEHLYPLQDFLSFKL